MTDTAAKAAERQIIHECQYISGGTWNGKRPREIVQQAIDAATVERDETIAEQAEEINRLEYAIRQEEWVANEEMQEENKRLEQQLDATNLCKKCGGTGEKILPDPTSGRKTGEWVTRCPDCSEETTTPEKGAS